MSETKASTVKPLPSRILGVDFGLSRIGLALSDETKIFATPLKIIKAGANSALTVRVLLDAIAEITRERRCEISQIVIGLPLMMSGKTGFIADEVRHFAKLLGEATPTQIVLWDERLSTVQAERSLRESEMSRKKRTKVVDMVSACIILQSYLDSCNTKHVA